MSHQYRETRLTLPFTRRITQVHQHQFLRYSQANRALRMGKGQGFLGKHKILKSVDQNVQN